MRAVGLGRISIPTLQNQNLSFLSSLVSFLFLFLAILIIFRILSQSLSSHRKKVSSFSFPDSYLCIHLHSSHLRLGVLLIVKVYIRFILIKNIYSLYIDFFFAFCLFIFVRSLFMDLCFYKLIMLQPGYVLSKIYCELQFWLMASVLCMCFELILGW